MAETTNVYRIRVWQKDSQMLLNDGCEWRAASGGGWKLWQRLPYLSSETCASSAKKDPGAASIITALSYSGGTLEFEAKTLSQLATLEFENGAGDTESNGTGAEKWVEVPFHNGTYDFFIPKPIELEVYTNAWIDSSDVLHTARGTVSFKLAARAYTDRVDPNSNAYDRRFQFCADPILTSAPPESAFDTITEQNGIFTTTRTPLFGVRNCNGAAYGDWVGGAGWSVLRYPSSEINRVPVSALDRTKTYVQDFVMAPTSSAVGFTYTDYLDARGIKLALQYTFSTTVWPWSNACSKIEY